MDAIVERPAKDKPKAAPEKREWEFPKSLSIPIPATATARHRPSGLPFKGLFDEDQDDAVAGKKPHRFVPLGYFEDRGAVGPGGKKADITHEYARTKIREQYRKWQKEDLPKRSDIRLVFHNRPGTEEGFPQVGVSYWLFKGE